MACVLRVLVLLSVLYVASGRYWRSGHTSLGFVYLMSSCSLKCSAPLLSNFKGGAAAAVFGIYEWYLAVLHEFSCFLSTPGTVVRGFIAAVCRRKSFRFHAAFRVFLQVAEAIGRLSGETCLKSLLFGATLSWADCAELLLTLLCGATSVYFTVNISAAV